MNNNFKVENYPQDIASKLIELCGDMDVSDYIEDMDATKNDLTEALYNLKAICENEYNNSWRVLYSALDILTSIN